jgi:hypothetical protein
MSGVLVFSHPEPSSSCYGGRVLSGTRVVRVVEGLEESGARVANGEDKKIPPFPNIS